MFYKNSLKTSASGLSYELAKYDGEFRNGKREGKGTMTWGDGTTFTGIWKNDMRHKGNLIMTVVGNTMVYIGSFVEDRIHCDNGQLLLPNMNIYQGSFENSKTLPTGMLLYPDGSVYYGQQEQFMKHGIGKKISLDGSFEEGDWEGDKLCGTQCRVFNVNTGDLYSGGIDE